MEEIIFHKDILVISLLNLVKIKKCYSEVLGLNYIDHLSINIVNPQKEIVFLSSTPLTGINVCATELWKHDSSIHSQTFTTKSFYWWEECYDHEYYQILKNVKEKANGLNTGFILAKKVQDFYFLYSFASHKGDPAFRESVLEFKDYFMEIGDHCYGLVKELYSLYSGNYEPPSLLLHRNNHNE